MDALIYLARYGRKEDKQPIWDHYLAWHARWQGKADALDSSPARFSDESYLGLAVGENLAHALLANQGWLTSAAEASRIVQMCVGQQMCSTLQQLARQASMLTISASRNGPNGYFHVAQYDQTSIELFEQKIEQFDKGTTFQLAESWPRSEAVEAEVRRIVTEHEMTLLEPQHTSASRFSAP